MILLAMLWFLHIQPISSSLPINPTKYIRDALVHTTLDQIQSISPLYLSPGQETQLELIGHYHRYLLLPLTEHQGAVNAKSRLLFPGSAQQPSQKDV